MAPTLPAEPSARTGTTGRESVLAAFETLEQRHGRSDFTPDRSRFHQTLKRYPFKAPPHCRIRQDKVSAGNITLRYRSRLYHVAVGRRHERARVLILVADRDVRVLTLDGTLIRRLTLDPQRAYQPLTP